MKSSFALLLTCFLGSGQSLPSSDFNKNVFQNPLLTTQEESPALIDVEPYLIRDPAAIADKVFDYIIVGGGLTGLTVANRLTEDPDIDVLVIESGYWESDRSPAIFDLTHYGRIFETAVDHKFTTETQKIDNRMQTIHSGHGLGGSTLINGGTWTRPAKVQVDSWKKVFGNDGWTWEELVPYMQKAENVRRPTERQAAAGQYFNASCHGVGGPVQVGSRDTNATYSPMMKALMDTVEEAGVPVRHDLSCGDPRGVSMFPNSVTLEGKRCDAGRAWLLPVVQRPNLNILVGQWVGKVLLDTSGETVVATGVQYGRHRAKTYEVHAKFEVLVAAGSSVSPLILEYSGIGIPRVLKDAGVETIVDLPVGINQQDQTTTGIRNSANEAGAGQGQAAYFASFNETFGDFAPTANKMLNNRTLLRQWARDVVCRDGFHDVDLLMMQYDNYVDHIQNHDVAYSELFFDTYGKINFDLWNLLPFGRGYIHIRDADPYLRDLDNDPQYFSNELDILGQAAATKLARELSSKGHMSKFWKEELTPGYDVVPEHADIHTWANWVKANYRANYHSVGTCSMMKKEYGGVVNNKAQVYGVEGLRVIDGSIVPTQVSSHVMTVFYGMAEKIAESVKRDHDKAIEAEKKMQKKLDWEL